MTSVAAVTLVSLAIALTAAALCCRQVVRVSAERRDLLRDCSGLFDEAPTHGIDRAGFGCLSGRVRGLRVHVGLLAESLAFRRLPQLWLRIEIRAEMGGRERLNVIRRSTNVEFYAPATDLPLPHDVPPEWPQDTLVRGTPGSQALMRALTEHAGALLADPRLKEILLTPRGLRVSSQASEGERGAYLLLRGSRFGEGRIAPHRLRIVLNETVGLAHALLQQGDRDAGRQDAGRQDAGCDVRHAAHA